MPSDLTGHECRRGARLFFQRHGLSWDRFLTEGVEIDVIEATGDAMGLAVAERVRLRDGG